MKTIELKNITKKYHDVNVLDNINYTFMKGNCYLIIGGNGSGKSSLIKIICGINFSQKRKLILDSIIGYVPEKFIFPDNIKVIRFLYSLGIVRNLRKKEVENRINEYMNKWGISNTCEKKISELSKGTQQKILLIQAFIHNPQIFIFDEPLNGLDLKMRKLFFKEIEFLKKEGLLVIIASHYPKSYLKNVDYVLKIMNGKIYEKINDLSL